MLQSRFILLLAIVFICALTTIEAAAIEKRKHHHHHHKHKKSLAKKKSTKKTTHTTLHTTKTKKSTKKTKKQSTKTKKQSTKTKKHSTKKTTKKTSSKKKTTSSTKSSSSSSGDSWSFSNWNSFKTATVGRGSDWDGKWGIPDQSGWSWVWNGADDSNDVLVKDPSGDSSDLILSVTYPKGSRNPEYDPNGGIGFKAKPFSIDSSVQSVEFEYSVYFPKGFDFVKGGKLPGLFGGHGECTGGDESDACFTTRIMWREDGDGEIYAYLPTSEQRDDLCDEDNNVCNSDYGYSLGRGAFKFDTGSWVSVRQVLSMNTVGKQDGSVTLYINDDKVIDIPKLVFRTESAGRVVGILFHTFFGGSDDSWETPKQQKSYFKDFSLKVSS